MADGGEPFRRLPPPHLTPREWSVLRLLVSGYSNKEMARQFGVSPRTIEIHRQRITNKARARNGAHLAALAARHGWVTAIDEPREPRLKMLTADPGKDGCDDAGTH